MHIATLSEFVDHGTMHSNVASYFQEISKDIINYVETISILHCFDPMNPFLLFTSFARASHTVVNIHQKYFSYFT